MSVTMIRHSHIFHGPKWTGTTLGDFSSHPILRSQRSTSIPAAIHRLGEDRVRTIFAGLNQHVVGFCRTEAKLFN